MGFFSSALGRRLSEEEVFFVGPGEERGPEVSEKLERFVLFF